MLDAVVAAGEAAQARLDARAPSTALGSVSFAGGPSITPLPISVMPASSARAALPAASELSARQVIAQEVPSPAAAVTTDRPIETHVTLTVDGETLARASARAQRGLAVRSFVPVLP